MYNVIELKKKGAFKMNDFENLLKAVESKIQFIKERYSNTNFEKIMGTEHFYPLTNGLGIAYRQARNEFDTYISVDYKHFDTYKELSQFMSGLIWREAMLKATFMQLQEVSKLVHVK